MDSHDTTHTSPYLLVHQPLPPAACRLLRAIGAPQSLDDSVSVSNQIALLTLKVNSVIQTETTQAWAMAAQSLHLAIEDAAQSHRDRTTHWHQEYNDASVTFKTVTSWHTPPFAQGQALTQLCGLAIVHAASHGSTIPEVIGSGLQVLSNALKGKGRRSADWLSLLDIDFLDVDKLDDLLLHLPPKSACQAFVWNLRELLSRPILMPPVLKSSEGETSQVAPVANDGEIRTRSSSENPADRPSKQTKPISTTPDIGARLAAANFATPQEKLGLHHRDHLLLDDLSHTTQQLTRLLRGHDVFCQRAAALYLICLITGCTDHLAVNLRFLYKNNIWLDLKSGHWCWDFRVYRNGSDTALTASTPESICIPLPEDLAFFLKNLYEQSPSTTTLGELLGLTEWDQKPFRKQVRQVLLGCGEMAHPAYRARFACSLGPAMLQITGSDMSTALLTGWFTSTAPASLYYYKPNTPTLQHRIERVYDHLHLDKPAAIVVAPESSYQHTDSFIDSIKNGFSLLWQELLRCRSLALEAKDTPGLIDACNQWMALACTAFVIHSAHRGTRLENLDPESLFGHPDVLLLHDKDDVESSKPQPRLCPKTDALNTILGTALACRSLVHQRTGARPTDQATPFFVKWHLDEAGKLQQRCLTTKDISTQTQKHFEGAPHNFGRALLITALDQDHCDRWLIRSLSGHARDVTRTSGAYMDVPPLAAAKRLKVTLQSTTDRLFPPLECVDFKRFDQPRFVSTPWKPSPPVRSHQIPDPLELLSPLSSSHAMGAAVAVRIQEKLLRGEFEIHPTSRAVLHMVLLDLVPDPWLAIHALVNPAEHLETHGRITGLRWKNNYFLHPFWQPLNPITNCLIAKLEQRAQSSQQIARTLAVDLQQITGVQWPSGLIARIDTLRAIANGYKRLHWPPSLQALAHARMPSPCFSFTSLERLAGQRPMSPIVIFNPKRRSSGHPGADIIYLKSRLTDFVSSSEQSGDPRRCAAECLESVYDYQDTWTPLGMYFRNWVVDELKRCRDATKDCYAPSTIYQYTFECLRPVDAFPEHVSPAHWDDILWHTFLNKVDGTGPLVDTTKATKVELSDRTRNAVSALVRSLDRQGVAVPESARERLQVPAAFRPRGSAASALILESELEKIREIINNWYADIPYDLVASETRLLLHSRIPSRSMDVSSLKTNCVTRAGGLCFEHAGFTGMKNDYAVRVVDLEQELHSQLQNGIDAIQEIQGNLPYLFRGDGSRADILHDDRLKEDLSMAMKIGTGDNEARLHSLRSKALQDRAWPEWESTASSMLQSTVHYPDLLAKVDGWTKEWTRTASATAVAGHADLRAAMGHYFAAWPIILSIFATTTWADTPPSGKLLNLLGLEPATLRKAKSRFNLSNTARTFDDWSWVVSRVLPPQSDTTCSSHQEEPRPQVRTDAKVQGNSLNPQKFARLNLVVSIRYMAQRALGKNASHALHLSKLPLSTGNWLDSLMPAEGELAKALQRARQTTPSERARNADTNLLMSEDGERLINWLLDLPIDTLETLHALMFRIDADLEKPDKLTTFLQRLDLTIPEEQTLLVKRGAKYFSTSEDQVSMRLKNIHLMPDERLGPTPTASLCRKGQDNRVAQARTTSITRLLTLITFKIRNGVSQHEA